MRYSTEHAIYIEMVYKSNKQTRKLMANYVNAVPDVGDKVRIDHDPTGYRVIDVHYEGVKDDTKLYTVTVVIIDPKNTAPKKLIANMQAELLSIANMLGV